MGLVSAAYIFSPIYCVSDTYQPDSNRVHRLGFLFRFSALEGDVCILSDMLQYRTDKDWSEQDSYRYDCVSSQNHLRTISGEGNTGTHSLHVKILQYFIGYCMEVLYQRTICHENKYTLFS